MGRVPVFALDASGQPTGEPVTLVVRALRTSARPVACASGADLPGCSQTCDASRVQLDGGRLVNDCAHKVLLWASASDNAGLSMGAVYVTSQSSPLILDAKRWHDGSAHGGPHSEVIGTLFLHLRYETTWADATSQADLQVVHV